MKGIILAGGCGTRLAPITMAVSKQLLPIYDKPMIYYPLSTLMLAGIKDILIITTPRDLFSFKEVLKDGSQWGLRLEYAVQEKPLGLAHAFIVGEKFIGESCVSLILGDNIFYGNQLSKKVREASKIKDGAIIFGYQVSDPERYGVVNFDKNGVAIELEEKPLKAKSNYAVTGLYFYSNDVVSIAKSIKPSKRGELEITDVNRVYLAEKRLQVKKLNRGFAWLDTGTHNSLLEANNFVGILQQRQNKNIACLEEIAWRLGYIDDDQLLALADPLIKTHYGQYMLKLIASNPS